MHQYCIRGNFSLLFFLAIEEDKQNCNMWKPLRDGEGVISKTQIIGGRRFIHHMGVTSIWVDSDNGNQNGGQGQNKYDIYNIIFLKKSDFYVHISRKYNFSVRFYKISSFHSNYQSLKLSDFVSF